MTTTPPWTILLSIEDAVLRLDVESAFAGAGHVVVRRERDGGVPWDKPVALALVDADPPNDETLRLLDEIHARRIPVLAFTGEETDGMTSDALTGARRLIKPFASDQLLMHAAGAIARRNGAEDGCTGDAAAGRSATG